VDRAPLHRAVEHPRGVLSASATTLAASPPPSFNLWLGIACVSFIAGTLFTLRGFTRRIAQLLPEHDGSSATPPR
jgi:hypothetical protein